MHFSTAIIRPPAPNFSAGLTTSELGPPDFQLALSQYNAYCAALTKCGLKLIRLEPDHEYPDSTFVEDTAVLVERFDDSSSSIAVVTRPGAVTRTGEVSQMRSVLEGLYSNLREIEAPGTLDGGDICQAGSHFFIGLSERTNEAGGKQLASSLASLGYTSCLVDIRELKGLLHLKSGLAYLGDGRLVVTKEVENVLKNSANNFKLVRVSANEEYAANCVRVNDYVLVAAGYPNFTETLRGLGYNVLTLEMSEFQKMDGGLSCLSLRL